METNLLFKSLMFKSFFKDILQSLDNRDFWIYSAKINTYKRYRRSTLGPWWLTINLLVFILSVGLIWSTLWKIDLKVYLPFFLFGMVFWEIVSSTVNKSISIYKLNENILKTINIPKLNFNFQVSSIVCINFLHNTLIFLPVGLIINILNSSYAILMLIPTLILFAINVFFLSVIISVSCVKFKDLDMILEHFMRIIFLITPIIWMPDIIPAKSLFLKINFLYPYVEIFRLPLTGIFPNYAMYLSVMISTLILSFFSIIIYEINKNKIVFLI